MIGPIRAFTPLLRRGIYRADWGGELGADVEASE